jgi:hypothetical protein
MKSGSGEDPFADAGSDDQTDDEGEGIEAEPERESGTVGDSTEVTTDERSATATQSSGLPWKYARENVKDGRSMVQFYLQPETKALESRAVAELESELDESVLTFDLREAAYRVALQQHLDDVADKLRDWGYDME